VVRLGKPLIRSLEILGFLNSMVYESLKDFDLICTGRGRREREVYFLGSLCVFFFLFSFWFGYIIDELTRRRL
jgi:hypothetical protein